MTTNLLFSGQVTVPADFASLHTPWPGSGSPPNNLNVGNIRLLNGSSGWMWSQIETSAGVYNWTVLDAAITAFRARGWTVSFPLYGTPTFYVSTADQAQKDPYNKYGNAGYPTLDTNLTALKAFIVALITRYNTPGGAWVQANPTLGKGIQTFETWNEPQFGGYSSGYWWGTPSQLTDVCYAAYSTVKGVDASIVVLSPGFFGSQHCWQWITSIGTLYPTKTATDTFDALNFHAYLGMPYGAPYCGWPFDIVYSGYGFYPIWLISQRYAGGKPIYMSEFGFDGTPGTPSLNSLMAESPDVRYTMLGRIMLSIMAMGARRFGCYIYGQNLCGDLVSDTTGVVAAFNSIAACAGKTITAATANINGAVSVSFSDGSSLTI